MELCRLPLLCRWENQRMLSSFTNKLITKQQCYQKLRDKLHEVKSVLEYCLYAEYEPCRRVGPYTAVYTRPCTCTRPCTQPCTGRVHESLSLRNLVQWCILTIFSLHTIKNLMSLQPRWQTADARSCLRSIYSYWTDTVRTPTDKQGEIATWYVLMKHHITLIKLHYVYRSYIPYVHHVRDLTSAHRWYFGSDRQWLKLLPHAVKCGRFCFWRRQSVVFCVCMKYLGNRWTDLRQIHTEDVFRPSLGRLKVSVKGQGHQWQNGIFRPFWRPACGLCFVKHIFSL